MSRSAHSLRSFLIRQYLVHISSTPSAVECVESRQATERRSCVSVVDVAALLVERGMLLESARGPIPNVAELVAGEPIRGSWWAHSASHAIFAAVN